MANPTLVNGQITDGVTQANVKVLGDAPAEPLAMTYQTLGHSVSLGMQNAALGQNQMNSVNQAATTQGANLLLSMDTAATTRATLKVLQGNSGVDRLLSLLASVAAGQEISKTAGATPSSRNVNFTRF